MARFLFATFEGGGHVQPMLLAARGLVERGDAVLAVSDACNGADAAVLGVPFRAWRLAPSRQDRSPDSDPIKDWLTRTPLETIQALCDGLMCGPAGAYGADAAEAIDTFGPDVVVSQELLFGVMAAAESRRRRLALFAANVWPLPTVPRTAPFGAGLPPPATDFDFEFYAGLAQATRAAYQHGLPALNAARRSLGLTDLTDIFEQLDAAGRVLLATSAAFDFESPLPSAFRYVGPYLADPVWTDDWASPWPADDARPLVLVSFSTMYQGQEAVLHRVIEALGRLNVRALVTLGPVLPASHFPAPDNVSVIASAPHSRVLPLASAVVTHAGHASALRPLIAGLPLVCIPLGRDQADNAARVAHRGAGLRLLPEASADDIAQAVRAVLEEPGYRHAAAALGARISADAAARSAETELIRVAEEAS